MHALCKHGFFTILAKTFERCCGPPESLIWLFMDEWGLWLTLGAIHSPALAEHNHAGELFSPQPSLVMLMWQSAGKPDIVACSLDCDPSWGTPARGHDTDAALLQELGSSRSTHLQHSMQQVVVQQFTEPCKMRNKPLQAAYHAITDLTRLANATCI